MSVTQLAKSLDLVSWVHVGIIGSVISIPLWPKPYLRYGAYLPLSLATLWQICGGCPLSQIQPELNGEDFTQMLLKPFYPQITSQQTTNLAHYALLSITTISMWRLSEA